VCKEEAVCCSVLQCVAVCCSALQCVAVRCSALQCVAVCCSVLQCVAVCCSVFQRCADEVSKGKTELCITDLFFQENVLQYMASLEENEFCIRGMFVTARQSVQCKARALHDTFLLLTFLLLERAIYYRALFMERALNYRPLCYGKMKCARQGQKNIDRRAKAEILKHCNTLQHTATHCNTLQCTLQHTHRQAGKSKNTFYAT